MDTISCTLEKFRKPVLFEKILMIVAIIVLFVGVVYILQIYSTEVEMGENFNIVLSLIFSLGILFLLFILSGTNVDVKEELAEIIREHMNETRLLKELSNDQLQEVRLLNLSVKNQAEEARLLREEIKNQLLTASLIQQEVKEGAEEIQLLKELVIEKKVIEKNESKTVKKAGKKKVSKKIAKKKVSKK